MFAGAVGYEAQVFVVQGKSPASRPYGPPWKARIRIVRAGILGSLVGVVGALWAAVRLVGP